MKIVATYFLLFLVAGVLAISTASWMLAIRRFFAVKSGLAPYETVVRAPMRWGLIDLVLNALLYLALTIGAVQAYWAFNPPAAKSGAKETVQADAKVETKAAPAIRPVLFLVSGAAQIASIVLGTLFLRMRAGAEAVRSLWSVREFGADAGLAIYAFGLVIVPVFIIQALLTQVIKYDHPAITPFRESNDWTFFACAAFTAVICAPLGEEYFFRGLFQGWLERFAVFGARSWDELLAPRPFASAAVMPIEGEVAAAPAFSSAELGLNPYAYASASGTVAIAAEAVSDAPRAVPHWPLWVVSGVFAMLHMSQGPAPVPLFIFSIALGYVFRYTGRILPCLMMHMMLNGLSMAMLAISAFVPQAV